MTSSTEPAIQQVVALKQMTAETNLFIALCFLSKGA